MFAQDFVEVEYVVRNEVGKLPVFHMTPQILHGV
jgi:hypothetical protein